MPDRREASTAPAPLLGPLSETRTGRGTPLRPGPDRERSAAVLRLRELAVHFAGEEITRSPVDAPWDGSKLWLFLKVTEGYVPETPEVAAEWAKVRAICTRLARKLDRNAVLCRRRVAGRRKQKRDGMLSSQLESRPARTDRARARESRPTRRAAGASSPSGDDPPDGDEPHVGHEPGLAGRLGVFRCALRLVASEPKSEPKEAAA